MPVMLSTLNVSCRFPQFDSSHATMIIAIYDVLFISVVFPAKLLQKSNLSKVRSMENTQLRVNDEKAGANGKSMTSSIL